MRPIPQALSCMRLSRTVAEGLRGVLKVREEREMSSVALLWKPVSGR